MTGTTSGRRRHVLVVGIDGVRYDTLQRARTPCLDGLAGTGFLRPVTVDAAGPTISGPCWATMATGVLPPRHHIVDNELAGHRLEDNPDFLLRAREAFPARRTYAAANWPQLVQEAHGGPIFAGGGFMPGPDPHHDFATWDAAEDALTSDACRVLGGDDVAAAFVYFGEPDAYGHELGVGPAYVASIERSDTRLARVLAAVRTRPSYAEEDWTVLVATDHGHLDAGGHGGDTPEERTAWLAATGPGVPTTPPTSLAQAEDWKSVV